MGTFRNLTLKKMSYRSETCRFVLESSQKLKQIVHSSSLGLNGTAGFLVLENIPYFI